MMKKKFLDKITKEWNVFILKYQKTTPNKIKNMHKVVQCAGN